MRAMKYLVIIEKGPKSYGAYVPDLPGCIAVGDTRGEVKKLIREAINCTLNYFEKLGSPFRSRKVALNMWKPQLLKTGCSWVEHTRYSN
jgi:predicted RNase H-like HicB family nuclease